VALEAVHVMTSQKHLGRMEPGSERAMRVPAKLHTEEALALPLAATSRVFDRVENPFAHGRMGMTVV
jgi:hypothetical protein